MSCIFFIWVRRSRVYTHGHAANPGTPDVQSTEMRLRRENNGDH